MSQDTRAFVFGSAAGFFLILAFALALSAALSGCLTINNHGGIACDTNDDCLFNLGEDSCDSADGGTHTCQGRKD